MKQRPSTSILKIRFSPLHAQTGERSARSLRWRLVALAGTAAIVVLASAGYLAVYTLRRSMVGDEDSHVANTALLSKQLVDRIVEERSRQVELIAASPTLIAAARKGADAAMAAGLPPRFGNTMTAGVLATIEDRYKGTRSLQADEEARRYLASLLPKLDIAEIVLTDRYGYNAVTTSLPSDFVQSDEGWWQTAWSSDGKPTTAQATLDSTTAQPVVEVAAAVKDGVTRVGVVKVKFGLSEIDSVLAQGSGAGSDVRVDLVDSAGKVIASSVPSPRFKTFGTSSPGVHALAWFISARGPGVFRYTGDSLPQLAAAAITNGGRWHVIAHVSERDASRAYGIARSAVMGGIAVILALIVALLVFVGRFVERRITRPAEALASAAEAVAGGDLSKRVGEIGGDDEVGRLARAVAAMIDELRRLATALSQSTGETTSMTADITASAEEMAASAGQIAHTAADLSQQANVMAETIQALAGSSEQLVALTSELDTGAHEGVERNAQLRTLALENRARLDDSAGSLAMLTEDVQANAASIEKLAEASEEVRTFVTLVQKLARQSKLLALNAAMEAARAGEHGQGFAVVAEEVRRLAAMSSEAAERTQRVVTGVLNGIAQSRTTSERTVVTVRAVRDATEQGSRSFGQIETALADADQWTSSIQRTVGAATTVTRDMRSRLDSLTAGTESFAAAMQEVAASSEEQSASTEQIASAASTLTHAADRLCRLVANLRLDDSTPAPPSAEPPPPVRAPDSASGVRPPATAPQLQLPATAAGRS